MYICLLIVRFFHVLSHFFHINATLSTLQTAYSYKNATISTFKTHYFYKNVTLSIISSFKKLIINTAYTFYASISLDNNSVVYALFLYITPLHPFIYQAFSIIPYSCRAIFYLPLLIIYFTVWHIILHPCPSTI